MGLSTHIILHPDTKIDHVAIVIAALAGYPATEHRLGCGGISASMGKTADDKDAVAVKSGAAGPEYCDINGVALNDPMVSGFSGTYCFEHKDGRFLTGASRPWWIAVGRALVDFFGGAVDYNDCDNTDVDYSQPKPQDSFDEEDEDLWQQFQNRMLAVKPLTKNQVGACRKLAGYK